MRTISIVRAKYSRRKVHFHLGDCARNHPDAVYRTAYDDVRQSSVALTFRFDTERPRFG